MFVANWGWITTFWVSKFSEKKFDAVLKKASSYGMSQSGWYLQGIVDICRSSNSLQQPLKVPQISTLQSVSNIFYRNVMKRLFSQIQKIWCAIQLSKSHNFKCYKKPFGLMNAVCVLMYILWNASSRCFCPKYLVTTLPLPLCHVLFK